VPFLEGRAIPPEAEGIVLAPRASREVESLFEHCRRAVTFTLARLGPDGLPLIGAGDWNDGLDRLGRRGRGQSVWLGCFLLDVLAGMAALAEARGDVGLASAWAAAAERLREAIRRMARGDRFVRATDDRGRELLLDDALSAAWPVLSGGVDLAEGVALLDRALGRLERDGMVLLLDPPFDEASDPYPGRIAAYPPGVRENGGQYSHGVSWLVDALLRLAALADAADRRGQSARLRARAVETWYKISPLGPSDPARLARYGLPPHQQPADVSFGPGYEERGGWAWYTGSAARMLSAAHGLLGLELRGGELVLPDDPQAPRGALRLRRLVWRGRVLVDAGRRAGAAVAPTPIAAPRTLPRDCGDL
jgi:cyclic beta-1,2-glucan synthetase